MKVKMVLVRREVRFQERESEDCLMVGSFVEVCRIRGLKVNVGRSKVMVLSVEEGS